EEEQERGDDDARGAHGHGGDDAVLPGGAPRYGGDDDPGRHHGQDGHQAQPPECHWWAASSLASSSSSFSVSVTLARASLTHAGPGAGAAAGAGCHQGSSTRDRSAWKPSCVAPRICTAAGAVPAA